MKTEHFHSQRGCLSYITYNENTKEAALIDPSTEIETKDYISFIQHNNLILKYIIETHTHADHISSCHKVKDIIGGNIIRHELSPSKSADLYVKDNDELPLGDETLKIIYTPGHTSESITIYNGIEAFTGDTLLIGGTGRTDFQVGNSEELYESLHEKIQSLPGDTIIRPGHNYKHQNSSLLKDEEHTNQRMLMCKDEFINFMDNYHPAKPELFEESIRENSR